MNKIDPAVVVDFQRSVFMATLVDIYLSEKMEGVTMQHSVKERTKVACHRHILANLGANYKDVAMWEKDAVESAYKAYEEDIDSFMPCNPYL